MGGGGGIDTLLRGTEWPLGMIVALERAVGGVRSREEADARQQSASITDRRALAKESALHVHNAICLRPPARHAGARLELARAAAICGVALEFVCCQLRLECFDVA